MTLYETFGGEPAPEPSLTDLLYTIQMMGYDPSAVVSEIMPTLRNGLYERLKLFVDRPHGPNPGERVLFWSGKLDLVDFLEAVSTLTDDMPAVGSQVEFASDHLGNHSLRFLPGA